MRKITFSVLVTILTVWQANCQTLSLKDCETIFLKKNLSLLAQQYNIEASKAAQIQAGLWENPYLSIDLNAYNPSIQKYFDIGPNGQKAFGIEQVIYIGRQKTKEKNIAKNNVQIAEIEFEQLLRALKLELHQNYFSIYYDKKSLSSINLQLKNLDDLIKAYQVQADKGNIAPKDVLRLQSLSVNLMNNKIQLIHSITEHETSLKTLLSITESIEIQPNVAEELNYWKSNDIKLDTLIQVALRNRNDLKIAEKEITSQELQLKWQKSLAIPNVTLGVNRDQASGAFPNQTNLTLGLQLPTWNRNQGNIKLSKAYLEQSKVNYTLTEQKIINEVNAAYYRYESAVKTYLDIDKNIDEKYTLIYDAVYKNFQKSNISIIEFADFMESYNQSIIQLNEMKKIIINACEEINYSTSSTLF